MTEQRATPFKIHLTPSTTGLLNLPQTPEAAETVSSLLQQDLESHHVFFNTSGYHNHIPHHLLTLFSTGASSSALRAAYAHNASYQRAALPPHNPQPQEPVYPASHLGEEPYYPDFLRFFQHRLASSSTEAVLTEFLLAGTPEADALLVRMFAGFLHPLIQLMFGVEFGPQPAVVAEGLAQAAVHSDRGLGAYLLGAEAAAAAAAAAGGGGGTMEELYAAVRRDEKLRGAARFGDGDKTRDGVLARAKEEMVRVAGRVRVGEEEVEGRTAEMFDAAVGVASAAALTPVKGEKGGRFDFFLIHHVNAAPIFLTFNKMEWVPRKTKARLLEWKMRMDLLQYAARGCPELDFERVRAYQPKCVEVGTGVKPIDIISRLHDFQDDGHAIKLGRAALICQEACRAFEGTPVADRFMIKGEDAWERVLGLIVDSVEAPGPNWVRSAGFAEAWEDIPDV